MPAPLYVSLKKRKMVLMIVRDKEVAKGFDQLCYGTTDTVCFTNCLRLA